MKRTGKAMPEIKTFFIDEAIPVAIHEPDRSPEATIVFLHGLMGYKDSEKFIALADAVVSEGWRAVRFDQAGSGQSKSFLRHSLIYSRYKDLVSVVKWLKSKLLQEEEKFILWGSSLGGYLAYLYAFLADDVYTGIELDDTIFENVPLQPDALVSWATPLDISPLDDFLRRTPPFSHQLDQLDPVGHPKSLEKIEILAKSMQTNLLPCLIVHGMKDEIVPWNQAVQLQRITKGDLILFSDADHRFSEKEHRDLATRASIRWIRRKLFKKHNDPCYG